MKILWATPGFLKVNPSLPTRYVRLLWHISLHMIPTTSTPIRCNSHGPWPTPRSISSPHQRSSIHSPMLWHSRPSWSNDAPTKGMITVLWFLLSFHLLVLFFNLSKFVRTLDPISHYSFLVDLWEVMTPLASDQTIETTIIPSILCILHLITIDGMTFLSF